MKKGDCETELPATFARWSRYCVVGLYAMSAIWGGLQIALPDSTRLYFLSALGFALFATFWARFDSKSRGITILPILQMLYFFFWPIGAVIYSVYRSGGRGLLRAGVHALGMILLMTATFYATLYGLHFAGLLDARYYSPQ